MKTWHLKELIEAIYKQFLTPIPDNDIVTLPILSLRVISNLHAKQRQTRAKIK